LENDMKYLILATALVTASAQAACLPPLGTNGMPVWVVSQNPRGCWAGWWCSPTSPYIAAATAQQCSLAGVQRNVLNWLRSPNASVLDFGANPKQNAELRAVWEPERRMLDAIRPKE
jgi:hypothetical protein